MAICTPPATSSTEASVAPARTSEPTGTGGRETDLVRSVVDAHGDSVHLHETADEDGDKREGEVAVCDGVTEGTRRCPFWVDVDPLVISRGVGEEADFLLGHGAVVRVSPDRVPTNPFNSSMLFTCVVMTNLQKDLIL